MDAVESRFKVLRRLGPNGLRRLVSGASSKLPSGPFFCDSNLFVVKGWRWRWRSKF